MTVATRSGKSVSLEQQRAAFAWQRIHNLAQASRSDLDAYTKLAKGAPALILNNGFMQTLAFYQSKGKRHHLQLSADLCAWLAVRLHPMFSSNAYKDVMTTLHGSGQGEYRRASEEALALLRWIRQLAAAANKSEA